MAEPFNPKFVDLVRNHTAVQGTGPVSLGGAVAGFTGFADAISAGEQFYYCIQGVDKPAEREVGRGTMQPAGTISRQPIGGPLTNFTAGDKTIALVAAAEWYRKVEQNGGGAAGAPAIEAATRSALAAKSSDGAALLTEEGREGLFRFEQADLSAMVAADTRQGIYVAPDGDDSGASGAWVRIFDGPINVRWFGAAADFVTDDLPAFNGAQAAIMARARAGYAGGDRLYVPAGNYFLSATFNVHCQMQIEGAGSAQTNGCATIIRFGKNCNGFVFNYGSTHGDGLGSQGTSEGGSLQGVQLWGGNVDVDANGEVTNYGAGDSTSGHGVRIRAPFVKLTDVMCSFFGGSGFHIVCTSGGSDFVNGNANNFHLERCQSIYNAGYAYEVSGNDANAGTVIGCSAVSCSGGGFIDYSFLGNNYFSLHVRDCGYSANVCVPDAPTGVCVHGGSNYYVAPGKAAQASTITPGTDSSVWVPFGGYADRPWASGKSWAIGAPFATNPGNANARNVVIGLYTEDGMSPVQASAPSLVFGGLHDNVGTTGSAAFVQAGAGKLQTQAFQARIAGQIKFAQLGGNIGSPEPDTWSLFHDGTYPWRLQSPSAAAGVRFTVASTSVWDSPAAHGGWSYPKRLRTPVISFHDGSLDGGRIHATINTAADLNGKTLTRGEIFYYGSPVAGGALGVACTTGGVGGAGAVLTEFGQLGLADASNAELWGGNAANRFITPARLFGAAASVALTDGPTISIDGNSGINFHVTLGGNRTLANPVNMKAGQSGRVRIKQDSAGSRTLEFGTAWLFAGGDPVLSTAANAIDAIAYFCHSPTEIEASLLKGLA